MTSQNGETVSVSELARHAAGAAGAIDATARTLDIGILARQHYEFSTVQALVRDGKRPLSEFHALQSLGGFRMIDISGGPDAPQEPWSAVFGNPVRGLKVRRQIAGLDAIVAMGEDVGLPAFLGLTAYGLRLPMICILHGTYFESGKFAAIIGMVKHLKHIRFLGMSTTVIDRLVKEFGIPAARCAVGGVGIDTDFFRPEPLQGEGVIASAGVVQRDYDSLFRAVEGLDVQVELATNSSWVAPVTFASALPANVKAGELPLHTGLRDLIARSRIVVVPLHPVRYSCGYTVIGEAMAMGKPVIASRNPGHSDLIVDGETGLYVPCADPAALRAAIVRLLDDPAEAARMGEAGRRRAEAICAMAPYAQHIRGRIAALGGLASRRVAA